MYGWTVLLEQTEKIRVGKSEQTSDEVVIALSDMKRACTAYTKGNFQEAMRLYPQFVDAYLAEIGKSVKDFDRQMSLCDIGKKACPNTRVFSGQKGLILYQYEKYDAAEKELAYALDAKPHDDNYLMHMGIIYMRRGEAIREKDPLQSKKYYKVAVDVFDKIIGINPMLYAQCFDYIAYIFSVTETGDVPAEASKFTAPCGEGAPIINLVEEEKASK